MNLSTVNNRQHQRALLLSQGWGPQSKDFWSPDPIVAAKRCLFMHEYPGQCVHCCILTHSRIQLEKWLLERGLYFQSDRKVFTPDTEKIPVLHGLEQYQPYPRNGRRYIHPTLFTSNPVFRDDSFNHLPAAKREFKIVQVCFDVTSWWRNKTEPLPPSYIRSYL